MSYEENLRSLSLDVDGTLGIYTGVPGAPGSAVPNLGKQYRFVKLTGTRTVGQCTAATDLVVGILQNKPQQAGEAGTIGYEGVSKVVSGAVFAAGALVAPDANGKAVSDSTNGRWIALMPATGADQLVSVMKIR